MDVYLSAMQQPSCGRSFSQNTTGITPEQITTDKEPALYPAVKNIFGANTKHSDSKYMNNVIEQDHRGIKSRYSVMKGFNNIFCALKFCTAFEEIRQFFRMKHKTRAERRRMITPKIIGFNELFTVTA